MNRVSDEASASVSEIRSAIDAQTGPADGMSSSPATTVNVNGGGGWRERRGIGVGAAALLTAGASVASVIYMRRRARAKVRKLAWLAVRAALVRAVLPRAAQVGGVGGGLLAAAVLQDRLRHRHSRTAVDELTERLAELQRYRGRAPAALDELSERLMALQTQADTRHLLSDRPHPRDLVLGAAVGLGLAGIIGRAASGRKSD